MVHLYGALTVCFYHVTYAFRVNLNSKRGCGMLKTHSQCTILISTHDAAQSQALKFQFLLKPTVVSVQNSFGNDSF